MNENIKQIVCGMCGLAVGAHLAGAVLVKPGERVSIQQSEFTDRIVIRTEPKQEHHESRHEQDLPAEHPYRMQNVASVTGAINTVSASLFFSPSPSSEDVGV